MKTSTIAAAVGLAAVGFALLNRNTDNEASTSAAPVAGGTTDARPRGIRNNNPLNIREGEHDSTKWDGEHHEDIDADFEEFINPFWGIRAAAKTLKTYRDKHNRRTIREIIARWAPAKENNVEAYVNSVVVRSGLFPDMYLVESDYPALIAAMIHHENGQQPYEMALIQEATAAGFA